MIVIRSRDHLGQDFPSLAAMARHWGKAPAVVWYRLEAGWSMEDALTKPATPAQKRNRKAGCKDHLGREFDSQKDMAAVWGISVNTFRVRLNVLHWSLEDALTKPPKLTGRPRKAKSS